MGGKVLIFFVDWIKLNWIDCAFVEIEELCSPASPAVQL